MSNVTPVEKHVQMMRISNIEKRNMNDYRMELAKIESDIYNTRHLQHTSMSHFTNVEKENTFE